MEGLRAVFRHALKYFIIMVVVAGLAVGGYFLYRHLTKEPDPLAYDVPFGAEYCISDLFPESAVKPSTDLHLVYLEGESFSTRAVSGKIYVTANTEGVGKFSIYSGENAVRKVNLKCVKESFYLNENQTKAEETLGSLMLGTKTVVPFNVYPSDFGDLIIEADSEFFEITEDNSLIPVGVGSSEIRVRAVREKEFKTFETNVSFNSSKEIAGAASVEGLARNRLGKSDGEPITASEFRTITNLYGVGGEEQLGAVEWMNGDDVYPMTSLETVYINAESSKRPVSFDASRYSGLTKLTIKSATMPSAAFAKAEKLTSITLDDVALTGSLEVSGCLALTNLSMKLSKGGTEAGTVTVSDVNPQVLSIEMPNDYNLTVQNASVSAQAEDETGVFSVIMNGGDIVLSQVALQENTGVSVSGVAKNGGYESVSASHGLWGCDFESLSITDMTADSFEINADSILLSGVKSTADNFKISGDIAVAEVTSGCEFNGFTLLSENLVMVSVSDGFRASSFDLSKNVKLNNLNLSGSVEVTRLNVSETKLSGLFFVDVMQGIKEIDARGAEYICEPEGMRAFVAALRSKDIVVNLGDNENELVWDVHAYKDIATAAARLATNDTLENVEITVSVKNASPATVVVPKNIKRLTLKVGRGLSLSDVRFVFDDTENPVIFNIMSEQCVLSLDKATGGVIDALRPITLNIYGNVTMNAKSGAAGSGGKSYSGSTSTGNNAIHDGGDGSVGGNSQSSAINAEGIYINVNPLDSVKGMFAVNGGTGGTGGVGGGGENSDRSGQPTAGKGGVGGTGGLGTAAIYSSDYLNISVNKNCSVKFVGGAGGKGGTGGKGGNGVNDNKRDNGGAGGQGGTGGQGAFGVICVNFTLGGEGSAQIIGGAGGNGGDGGRGGDAYKTGNIFISSGTKGKGGKGGAGGSGNTALNITGTQSIADGNFKLTNGSSGSSGSAGAIGGGNGNNP